MIKLMSKALDNAGYEGEATKENVIECFRDYVDGGTWSNLDLEEADTLIEEGELTITHMCRALIRL